MNTVNSKNMFFLVILFVILVVTFTYAISYNHTTAEIYTDLRDLNIKS